MPTKFYSYLVLALIVGAVIGGLTTYTLTTQKKSPLISLPQDQSIFSSQTAIINGVVKEVKENRLVIQNTENNKTQEFEVDEESSLSTQYPAGVATYGLNISTLQTNIPSAITLKYVDGRYKVSNILYNSNSQTPPATESASYQNPR